jgi:hypothetical protein
MDKLILQPDDERVGKLHPDNPTVWPSVDVTGKEYLRQSASIQTFAPVDGVTPFVVLSPNFKGEVALDVAPPPKVKK